MVCILSYQVEHMTGRISYSDSVSKFYIKVQLNCRFVSFLIIILSLNSCETTSQVFK
jgi:hypothetical protein